MTINRFENALNSIKDCLQYIADDDLSDQEKAFRSTLIYMCMEIGREVNETIMDRLLALEDFLENDARCPCCQELKICNNGCTFSEDCPDAHERMMEVRKLLYGCP